MLTIGDVRKKVDNLKNEKAKAEGGLDRIKKELKEKFDSKCMADAKKLLKQFTEEEKEAKTEYKEAITKFEETWDEEINNEN